MVAAVEQPNLVQMTAQLAPHEAMMQPVKSVTMNSVNSRRKSGRTCGPIPTASRISLPSWRSSTRLSVR
eukprot:3136932-Pyramimonas_sp.AAC.1